MTIFLLIGLGLFLATFVGMFALIGWRMREMEPTDQTFRAWETAAVSIPLEFKAKRFRHPWLEGKYRKRDVKIAALLMGGDETEFDRTIYTASHTNHKIPELRLLPSQQLIENTNALPTPFDQCFEIKCNSPKLANFIFFDQNLQEELLTLDLPTLRIGRRNVSLSEDQITLDAEKMRDRLELLTALAERIDRAREIL